jgi:transcriptional regulator with XRE-family HTH domain
MDYNNGVKASEFNKKFGQRIAKQRKDLKLSQTKLAEKLFVTFQQVQKYEKGLNGVSGFKIKQLSLALDVPVNYFFDYPITVVDGKLCSSNVPIDNRQNVSKVEPQDKQLDTKKEI